MPPAGSRPIRLVALGALAGLALCQAGQAGSVALPPPVAFTRAPGPHDRLPGSWRLSFSPTSVRLVAEATSGGRPSRLVFAYYTRSGFLCTAAGSPQSYGSSTCEPTNDLCQAAPCNAQASPVDWSIGDGYLDGLAGNSVTRVALALPHGQTVSLLPGAARGFLWHCSGSCACAILEIAAYAGTQQIGLEDLRNPATGRPYWC